MHQLVKDYLDEKNEIALKKKKELLIELGLYEKQYLDDENENSYAFTDEELGSEWDSKTNTDKYFKKIPVPVSDEEYAEILKYQKRDTKPTNTVSTIFKVFAWIVFIGGFIAGIMLGRDSYDDFSFGLAFVYWIAFFVGGMLYYGIAEIIQLLTDIKNK